MRTPGSSRADAERTAADAAAGVTARGTAHEKSARGPRRRLTHRRTRVEVEVTVRRGTVRIKLGAVCGGKRE